MKIINNILIIIFFFITVFCTQKHTISVKKPVVVAGKIHHFNGENTKLYLIYSQPGVKESRDIIDIDSVGNFIYRIQGYIPSDAMLLEKHTFANINFIYHPGDSIYIEFDAKDKQLPLLQTVSFSGDRAKTNNQIIKFQIIRETNNLGYGAINTTESYKKDLDEFIAEMDTVKEKQMKTYMTFIDDYNPTEEAKNWASLFALETYYYFLDDYGYENEVPDTYFNYNKNILPITLDKMICWRVLAYRINRYYSTIIKPKMFQHFFNQMEAIEAGTINIDSLIINFICNNSSDTLLNQLSISSYYTTQFDANIISGYEKNKELIKTKLSIPFIYNPLQERYKSVFEFVNKPGDLIDIVMKKMEGTPIKETFNKILSDNKGKLIYLDCWATSCGPCIKAMPASKELMLKFKGKEISFVYVCIESEEKLWKRLLSEFKLEGGQHYFMDRKQSEFFRDILKVKGIPYYFLMNKNGRIIEQGSHLHPGEKLTEEKIVQLLNES